APPARGFGGGPRGLPGHGHNRSVPDEQFTVAELAAGVLHVVDDLLAERGEVGGGFAYAGDPVGGGGGPPPVSSTSWTTCPRSGAGSAAASPTPATPWAARSASS